MMKKNIYAVGVMCLSLSLIHCSPSSLDSSTNFEGNDSNTGQQYTATMPASSGQANVMTIAVTGAASFNQPVATVTICTPGSTSACSTITNLLVDTGSYGLRIFASSLSASGGSAVPVVVNDSTYGNPLNECVSYLDGTGQWGAVKTADVYMGSSVSGTEKGSSIPIEIISTTAESMSPASNCSTAANLDSASSGYNGIIGVGLFVGDCGTECTLHANNGQYYSCTGSSCTGVTVSAAQMVSNPVAYLPSGFNNGVIMQFPNVADAGASSISGYLILGIGSQSNNTPGTAVNTYTADTDGNFTTSFANNTYTAFIDSGSNGLYFPGSSEISTCTDGFYCPSSEVNLLATQTGSNSASSSVSFFIANADQFSGSNMVFNNIGANMATYFDWGFPFFLGRTIFVGIDGKTVPVNSTNYTGPLWAY